MSTEHETKRLLGFRESMETRLHELEREMHDLQTAIEEVDKLIVNSGFRTFTTADKMVSETTKRTAEPKSEPRFESISEKLEPITESASKPRLEQKVEPKIEVPLKREDMDDVSEDHVSITSKDGTILGTMNVEDHYITFIPSESFDFTLDIPPFQSFLIDRVLENMKKTDQERSGNGELDPGEILDYEVRDEGGKIVSLRIENYNGERRLREISSSLRWAFDKMYDKILQG